MGWFYGGGISPRLHSFNDFDSVEIAYETTKPLAGAANKGKDIRPIGERRRKWERIHKFTDDCYGLMDGGTGDPVDGWEEATLGEMLFFAPILWRRHRDGSESVRIRNETGKCAHNSRYKFLEKFLPTQLGFELRNGKQFITSTRTGEDYFLAKSKTVTAHEMRMAKEHLQRQIDINAPWPIIAAYQSTVDAITTRDDGVALTFRRTAKDGTLRFDSGGKAPPKPPRIVVDTKGKRKHKQAIQNFWEWVVTMAPLMPVDDWTYRLNSYKELHGYTFHSNRTPLYSHNPSIPPEVALEIINDDNHPMRLNLAVHFVAKSDIKEATTEDDARAVRAQFNRWINKVCGFNSKK